MQAEQNLGAVRLGKSYDLGRTEGEYGSRGVDYGLYLRLIQQRPVVVQPVDAVRLEDGEKRYPALDESGDVRGLLDADGEPPRPRQARYRVGGEKGSLG